MRRALVRKQGHLDDASAEVSWLRAELGFIVGDMWVGLFSMSVLCLSCAFAEFCLHTKEVCPVLICISFSFLFALGWLRVALDCKI